MPLLAVRRRTSGRLLSRPRRSTARRANSGWASRRRLNFGLRSRLASREGASRNARPRRRQMMLDVPTEETRFQLIQKRDKMAAHRRRLQRSLYVSRDSRSVGTTTSFFWGPLGRARTFAEPRIFRLVRTQIPSNYRSTRPLRPNFYGLRRRNTPSRLPEPPRHSRMSLTGCQNTPAIDGAFYRPNSTLYQLQPGFHTQSTEPEPTARAR